MKWILPSGKLTCPLNRDYWTIGNTSTPSIIFQGKNVSFQVKNYQLFHRLGRKQIVHIQEVVRVFHSHFSTMGSGSSLSKIRKPGWWYYSHVNTLQTCVCTHLGEKLSMEFHMFFGSLATIGNHHFQDLSIFPHGASCGKPRETREALPHCQNWELHHAGVRLSPTQRFAIPTRWPAFFWCSAMLLQSQIFKKNSFPGIESSFWGGSFLDKNFHRILTPTTIFQILK